MHNHGFNAAVRYLSHLKIVSNVCVKFPEQISDITWWFDEFEEEMERRIKNLRWIVLQLIAFSR